MRAEIERLVPSRFVRFAIAGGVAAGANILSRIAFSHFWPYGAAIVAAYLVGMTVAYLLMLVFVFEPSGKSVANEYLRFGLVNALALAQVWLVSMALARWLFPSLGFSWNALTVAHIAGVVSPIATSYLGHKYFTFSPRRARVV